MSRNPSLLVPGCLALLAFAACAGQGPAETQIDDAAGARVSIMTFNVENLFDNHDDPGKDDKTFLPLAAKQAAAHKAECAAIAVERWRTQCFDWDWSDAMVERKLTAVAGAILQVDDGRGPDIVALQEIENLGILERLRTEYLADADYGPAILLEGHDRRGIDVAFLSRLKLAAPAKLHRPEFRGVGRARRDDTRGILEATFVLPDGGLLTGFAVHFPAPFHPTPMRETAYEHLNTLKAALPPDRPVFAAGDFNTTSAEDRAEDMLARYVRPDWIVAHEIGCEDCRGTSYYAPRDDWSFLDMILWSPGDARGEHATWRLRGETISIPNQAPGQTRPDGTPWRFEMPGGTGVSDHWPMLITIESLKNKEL